MITRLLGFAALGCVGVLVVSCGRFSPRPTARQEFLARAVAEEREGVGVVAVALTANESRRYFGVDLAGKGIQPVWLEIRNGNDYPVWYLPVSTDANYFAPGEVAYRFHSLLRGGTNRKIDEYFVSSGVSAHVPPRGTSAGFVFTHLNAGDKYVSVKLVGEGRLSHLRFVVPVPGGTWDYERVDVPHLYEPDRIVAVDLETLRTTLQSLPCCASNRAGSAHGDPLNLVVVGRLASLLFPFTEAGWSPTESLTAMTAVETMKAFFLHRTDLYSPLSPLYVFGRHQDVALQKARGTISERNHLRLWLTPYIFEGRHVWVGQIDRDIGVRFTTKSWYFTTHKISPNVDEDRDYLLQDLLMAEGVERFGFVGGVGAAPASAPRTTLTGDPYYTDGLRLVLFLADRPTPIHETELLRWETPPLVPGVRESAFRDGVIAASETTR